MPNFVGDNRKYSANSKDQHPPAAGSHAPKDVTNHGGGYGAGKQQVHPSLQKPPKK